MGATIDYVLAEGAVVLASLSCGAVVIVVEPLVVLLLRRAATIDVPGQRSSHTILTPRGSGATIALGLLAGTALINGTASSHFLLAVAGFSAVGLAEYLRRLPICCRLGLQDAASGTAVRCWRIRRACNARDRCSTRAVARC